VRVLVTGASGFVGRAVVGALRERGIIVRAAIRDSATRPEADESVTIPSLAETFDWRPALADVDVVIHAAALAHAPLDADRERMTTLVNRDATARLAEAVRDSSVRRLVFVSTAKVHGEVSSTAPFREDDLPAPPDAYARSKVEAERSIRDILGDSRITIVRPPLVYGPGVRAHFLALMSAVARGVPLPLGGVHNKRSLIAVRNLADALGFVCAHESAAGRVLLVSDGADVSTPELIRALALALHTRARLVAIPIPLLRMAATLTGNRQRLEKVIGSLAVDTTAIRALGWTPPVAFHEALAETAAWYHGGRRA
jgi:nucleoside-diphosphate-sugar epimerase